MGVQETATSTNHSSITKGPQKNTQGIEFPICIIRGSDPSLYSQGFSHLDIELEVFCAMGEKKDIPIDNIPCNPAV